MRISDWSSDVCSSDLLGLHTHGLAKGAHGVLPALAGGGRHVVHTDRGIVAIRILLPPLALELRQVEAEPRSLHHQPVNAIECALHLTGRGEIQQIERASWWERGCPYV